MAATAAVADALPGWVAGYLRLRYAHPADVAAGEVDCWELARRVLAEQAGTALPDWGAGLRDWDEVAARLAEVRADPACGWVEVAGEPQPFDVAVMAGFYRPGGGGGLRRADLHIGIVPAAGWVLHAEDGPGVVCQRLSDRRIAHRLRGFWRASAATAASCGEPAGDGLIPVVSRPHPLRSDRAVMAVPAGATVLDIVSTAQPDQGLWPFLSVHVGGEEVPGAAWPHVRPKAGVPVIVNARCAGGGGGKQVLGIVAQLALAAALAASGNYVMAGLVVAGTIANAIMAPAEPKADKLAGVNADSPTLSLTAAKNQIRPWSPVPVVLGRHRQTPALGAKTYTELEGGRQYLRLLFVHGVGPLKVEERKIGSTALAEFQWVETEFRRGYQPAQITDKGAWSPASAWPAAAVFGDRYTVDTAGTRDDVTVAIGDTITCNGCDDPATAAGWDLNADKPLALFPSDVDEDPESVRLTTAWVVRTTGPDADEISWEIQFPMGLYEYDSKGNKQARAVEFRVEYSVTGADVWTEAAHFWETRAQTSLVRIGGRFTVARGQYDVRMRRGTEQTYEDGKSDEAWWSMLRTIRATPPADITGLCVETMRIRASGQLSGTLDDYSAIVTSIVPDWTGSAWVTRPTQNPAALFRAVLQGGGIGVATPDAEIDIPQLQAWAEFCTARGWTFNQIIDYRTSVRSLLSDIAAAGRASFYPRDNLASVLIDQPSATALQTFAARDTANWAFDAAFKTMPHAYRCRFVNEAKTWEWDEVVVYAPGQTALTATVFEERQFTGVTNRDQVWSLANYLLAVESYRSGWTWRFSVNIKQLASERGDRIEVQHDMLRTGICSARIVAVNRSFDLITSIDIDQPVTLAAGLSYVAIVRASSTGVRYSFAIQAIPGDTSRLTLVTPATTLVPAAGDLLVFGTAESVTRDMIIVAIDDFTPDMGATIYCQAYAPQVYTAGDEAVPPYIPGGVATSGLVAPVITEIRADGSAVQRAADGSWSPRIIVSVKPVSGFGAPAVGGLEANWRLAGTDDDWLSLTAAASGPAVLAEVTAGAVYDVRLRWIGEDGRRGPWTATAQAATTFSAGPPPDLDSFTVQVLADGTRSFTGSIAIPPADVIAGGGYRIRYQAGASFDWDTATPLNTGTISAWPYETNQVAAGEWTFGCKAVNSAGEESVSARTLTATLPDPRLGNALLQRNFAAEGWPDGTLTDCFRAPDGSLEALAEAGNTWADLGAATWADFGADDWFAAFPRVTPIRYTSPVIDLGVDAAFNPLISPAGGGTLSVEIRTHTAAEGSDLSAAAWVLPGPVTAARYAQVRLTAGGPLITGLDVILSGAVVVDSFQDLNTATASAAWFQRVSAGKIRVGHRLGATTITRAAITAIQSSGTQWTWRLVSKAATIAGWSGPCAEFELYSAGTLADAIVDIDIGGTK